MRSCASIGHRHRLFLCFFCTFTLCILRKYLQTNAWKPQRLSNFFKTWVIKDFLRIIWVNISRIFVGKLGENCQSSLVFCGYDDWRSDKVENYTRRGTVPQRVKISLGLGQQTHIMTICRIKKKADRKGKAKQIVHMHENNLNTIVSGKGSNNLGKDVSFPNCTWCCRVFLI